MSAEKTDYLVSSAIVGVDNRLGFKTPEVPKPKPVNKVNILDEETYLNEIGNIIERDFFPDLKKLKAQNDYLEAIERNDVRKIRELYAKYSSGRIPQPCHLASPATFETPIDTRPSDEYATPSLNEPKTKVSGCDDETESVITCNETKKKLSLDEYFGCHTSEDNQSFQEIIKESDIQHKHKHPWLYATEENCHLKETNLPVPSIEEQANGKDRPLNLDTWSYRRKNYIMYVPDGADLSESEKSKIVCNKLEINHNSTRLAKCPFDETQNKETIQGLALSQSRILEGKIGVDGKELTFGDVPKVNGFSFVEAPSPAPGVNESPLMTWGNIDGTPFRLDGGDTPIRSTPGPSFKIPEPPKREKLALALAEKAGERIRDRKKKALLVAQRQLASPSPSRTSGSSLDILQSMSPAAQKLASTKLKRVGSDRSLLASYSPLNRTPINSTPSPRAQGTPKTSSSKHLLNMKSGSTPKSSLGQNITDNLLNLPLLKRPRAADYFNL